MVRGEEAAFHDPHSPLRSSRSLGGCRHRAHPIQHPSNLPSRCLQMSCFASNLLSGGVFAGCPDLPQADPVALQPWKISPQQGKEGNCQTATTSPREQIHSSRAAATGKKGPTAGNVEPSPRRSWFGSSSCCETLWRELCQGLRAGVVGGRPPAGPWAHQLPNWCMIFPRGLGGGMVH